MHAAHKKKFFKKEGRGDGPHDSPVLGKQLD
jgi:hypothetical protein